MMKKFFLALVLSLGCLLGLQAQTAGTWYFGQIGDKPAWLYVQHVEKLSGATGNFLQVYYGFGESGFSSVDLRGSAEPQKGYALKLQREDYDVENDLMLYISVFEGKFSADFKQISGQYLEEGKNQPFKFKQAQ